MGSVPAGQDSSPACSTSRRSRTLVVLTPSALTAGSASTVSMAPSTTMLPAAITASWSQTATSDSIRCSARSTAVPVAAIRSIAASTRAVLRASRCAVGSSRMRWEGRIASKPAITTSCSCPPERPRGSRAAKSLTPTVSRAAAARSTTSSRARPRLAGPNATSSITVSAISESCPADPASPSRRVRSSGTWARGRRSHRRCRPHRRASPDDPGGKAAGYETQRGLASSSRAGQAGDTAGREVQRHRVQAVVPRTRIPEGDTFKPQHGSVTPATRAASSSPSPTTMPQRRIRSAVRCGGTHRSVGRPGRVKPRVSRAIVRVSTSCSVLRTVGAATATTPRARRQMGPSVSRPRARCAVVTSLARSARRGIDDHAVVDHEGELRGGAMGLQAGNETRRSRGHVEEHRRSCHREDARHHAGSECDALIGDLERAHVRDDRPVDREQHVHQHHAQRQWQRQQQRVHQHPASHASHDRREDDREQGQRGQTHHPIEEDRARDRAHRDDQTRQGVAARPGASGLDASVVEQRHPCPPMAGGVHLAGSEPSLESTSPQG